MAVRGSKTTAAAAGARSSVSIRLKLDGHGGPDRTVWERTRRASPIRLLPALVSVECRVFGGVCSGGYCSCVLLPSYIRCLNSAPLFVLVSVRGCLFGGAVDRLRRVAGACCRLGGIPASPQLVSWMLTEPQGGATPLLANNTSRVGECGALARPRCRCGLPDSCSLALVVGLLGL